MTDDRSLNKELTLLQTLYFKTSDHHVEWEEGPPNARAFQTQLGKFTLRLKQIFDSDYPEEPDYELLVIDSDSGKELERISNTTLRPIMDRTTVDGLNPYRLLDRTYKMARRRALHVDEALETLIQDLANV